MANSAPMISAAAAGEDRVAREGRWGLVVKRMVGPRDHTQVRQTRAEAWTRGMAVSYVPMRCTLDATSHLAMTPPSRAVTIEATMKTTSARHARATV